MSQNENPISISAPATLIVVGICERRFECKVCVYNYKMTCGVATIKNVLANITRECSKDGWKFSPATIVHQGDVVWKSPSNP